VVGYALGEGAVGSGGEVDGAAGGVLLLEELEEFAIVGEMSDIQLDGAGDVALEGGFALEEPAGEFEEVGWALAGEDERGVVESVGFDQRAIEVDAEREQPVILRGGSRGGHEGESFLICRQQSAYIQTVGYPRFH
jgi:hypothetical protein